jgi:exopolysaccharide production protein ExoZ
VNAAIDTSIPLKSPAINQIDGLQIMRAVAVLFVAWVHLGQGLASPLPGLGVFGVDIFFCISGFIICSIVLRLNKSAGPATSWYFLKRRLVRIFPIYWVIASVCAVRLVLHHQFSFLKYLPGFLLLPSLRYPDIPLLVAFSWTLLFEMFFYYVVAAVLLVSVRRAVPCIVALLVLCVSLRFVVSIKHPVLVIFCNPLLLEFLFGTLLALLFRQFGRKKWLGISLLTLGFCFAVGLQWVLQPVNIGQQTFLADYQVLPRVFTWGIAAAMMIGGVVFWSPQIKTVPGKIAVVLGNASYSIYLLSPSAIEILNRIFTAYFHGAVGFHVWQIFTVQCLGVILVFFLGWLCYRLVERPLLNRLQRYV